MAQTKGKYLFVEFPDQDVTIDFAGLATVTLKATKGDPSTLRIEVKGLDDRATILLDQELELPVADEKE
jgi:hypothetical protein